MGISFYRESALPFLEAKACSSYDFGCRKHFHEELSVGIVRKSSTAAWYDGRTAKLEEGALISFPPLLPHACSPEAGSGWSYDMLFISPEWTDSWLENPLPLRRPLLADGQAAAACSSWVSAAMSAMSGGGTPLEIETPVIGLVKTLDRLAGAQEAPLLRRGAEKAALRRAKDFIHEHFREKVTLDMLERAAGLSRYHLIRLFKLECGLPPAAYQNMLRLNLAKSELALGEKPLAEIALEAGYYDQSHFSRSFRAHVGVSPSRYASS